MSEWTKDIPKEAGWYWVTFNGTKRPIYLMRDFGSCAFVMVDGHPIKATDMELAAKVSEAAGLGKCCAVYWSVKVRPPPDYMSDNEQGDKDSE